MENWWNCRCEANRRKEKCLKGYLGKPDIISEIKDSQYKFIQKVGILQAAEAFVKAFSMCKDLPIYKYYKNLQADNQKLNKIARIGSVNNSSTIMFLRSKQSRSSIR